MPQHRGKHRHLVEVDIAPVAKDVLELEGIDRMDAGVVPKTGSPEIDGLSGKCPATA